MFASVGISNNLIYEIVAKGKVYYILYEMILSALELNK